MSAPALDVGAPTLRIRGTPYPVLLPRLRDPRLHLAAVIVSLQVLGQAAFAFDLSIAQILVSLGTCAVLEVAIAFRRQKVILWPASALLTGNGVAFVLRVPGTEHGDWWSMRGWWLFAGTAAVALLSKHLVRFRGSHVFNPSNLGLVACFLLLGPERADPLALWWGPLSVWLALALAIIVTGGLAILARLRLLAMAVGFWLVFAAGAAVLAASGHAMTARWHLGPITGTELWRVLVFSPEILVFLFFMITDPRTIPAGRRAQAVFAASVATLSVVLIAPFTTEFATKVAVLGALTIACGARPLLALAGSSTIVRRAGHRLPSGPATRAAAALAGVGAVAAVLVLTGPAPDAVTIRATSTSPAALPSVSVVGSDEVATRLDRATAERIVADLLRALRTETEALRAGSKERAADGADGALLAAVWGSIERSGRGPVVVPDYDVARVQLRLEPGPGQGQPIVVAALEGTLALETWQGSPRELARRDEPTPFSQAFELRESAGRYVLAGARGGTGPGLLATPAPGTGAAPGEAEATRGLRLEDVAASVGLDFRHGAFRFGVSGDPEAMMGGGLCWLDADGDGWLDLF
ncbi:MAG: hypothetical protein OEW65_04250, partial [Thermoleophilia bacterium]|nr:hypothetical protein [Thermoleophilia bacterium]